MACPITVAKFVGTISLGLLTGLSYTVSTIAIPALQVLPSASSAARALKVIQSRTRKHVLALSQITAISLLTAFTLSSSRRRHPYLIWTGLTALIGGGGLEWWFGRAPLTWSFFTSGSCCLDASASSSSTAGFGIGSWIVTGLGGGSSSSSTGPARKQEDEESGSANGSEIEIVEGEEAEAAVAAAPEVATPTSEDSINGETVKLDMESERTFQRLRTCVLGLGFSMGVVGIWGDRM